MNLSNLLSSNLWDALPLLFYKAVDPIGCERVLKEVTPSQQDLFRFGSANGKALEAEWAAQALRAIDEAKSSAAIDEAGRRLLEAFCYADDEIDADTLYALIVAVRETPTDRITSRFLADVYSANARPLTATAPCDLQPPHDICFLITEIVNVLGSAVDGGISTIYLPTTTAPTLLGCLVARNPSAAIVGADPDVQNVYASTMCGLLDGRDFAISEGVAIDRDTLPPDYKADIAIACLPLESTYNIVFDENDPRWTFCVPAAGRESYAWVQQAIAHLDDNGYAILLMPSVALTTTHVNEYPARRMLIDQGRVYMSITLPGRLFEQSSAVAHVVVIGPERSTDKEGGCSTLFVDAQELGVERDGSIGRVVGQKALQRILHAVKDFAAGADPHIIHFATTVHPSVINDSNDDLLASSYVFSHERHTSSDYKVVDEALMEKLDQLRIARSDRSRSERELEALLMGLGL